MNLTINGHQLTVTEMMETVVRTRLGELAARLESLRMATSVRVLFSGRRKNGWAQKISMQILIPGRKPIEIKQFLNRSIGDFYDAIRHALNRLNEVLRFRNETRKQHRRVPIRRAHLPA